MLQEMPIATPVSEHWLQEHRTRRRAAAGASCRTNAGTLARCCLGSSLWLTLVEADSTLFLRGWRRVRLPKALSVRWWLRICLCCGLLSLLNADLTGTLSVRWWLRIDCAG
jgi:hypothetical protein